MRPVFTSIGLFILDDIEFENGKGNVQDVIGGAGTYAGLGARFFLPGEEGKKACWIVDKGSDFPEAVKEEMENWQAGVVFRDTPHRLTTRAQNKYGANELRGFAYKTPKVRIEVDDLLNIPPLLQSQSFHLICSPSRCMDITTKLHAALGDESYDALVVWEPVPPECKPDNLEAAKQALQHVDIVSPNAQEAAAFFGQPEPTSDAEIELLASQFLSMMVTNPKNAIVVIRSGARGCLVSTAQQARWFPAYHSKQLFPDCHAVNDPTGGGNAFLGGFTCGYLKNKNIAQAAVYGNVAAGLAIEQVGQAKLKLLEDGTELWNNSRVEDRIDTYCVRYDVFY